MKISARNQIKATVASMTTGMVNERITLLTSKGAKLSSVITSESAKEMSLKEGDTVTALFKATHVMLSTAHIDGISARNQLEGTIENVVKGMVSTEVTLVLEGGEHIVSIVTNEAAEELGVESGKKAVAIIKSSDIMLAK
ncbi:TOBE domain-containing protein [Sulfurovum sp.]|jgi:molybdate transport system regulatory protein|uniref:TOBE domain-containing protein n=1 Tax=Sulfurovum sp. TaxID=1969726 RepID=UPI002A368E04|nr:TOBE domain-containing protein [Sulfurovum sp.]MDY0402238.1 TOBE domain-containing protein [Sulfurovum sp.]